MCPKGHGGLYTRGICWPGAGPAKEFGSRMWTRFQGPVKKSKLRMIRQQSFVPTTEAACHITLFLIHTNSAREILLENSTDEKTTTHGLVTCLTEAQRWQAAEGT